MHHGRGSERRQSARQSFPNQFQSSAGRIHLELELYVGTVVQVDAHEPTEHEEEHQGPKRAKARGAWTPYEPNLRHQAEPEQHQRNELPAIFRMAEEAKLDAYSQHSGGKKGADKPTQDVGLHSLRT